MVVGEGKKATKHSAMFCPIFVSLFFTGPVIQGVPRNFSWTTEQYSVLLSFVIFPKLIETPSAYEKLIINVTKIRQKLL